MKRRKNTVWHDYVENRQGSKGLSRNGGLTFCPQPANWREFTSLDSVSARLDASSIFADRDDGDPGKQARVVRHAQNPLCMLLGLVLTYKPLGGTRDEFGSYEIDPVISHVIFLSDGAGS